MKLTQEQIDYFNREGWLFLPELFSQEEVDFLAREAVGIYDANRPEVWREKSGAPRTAFAAHLYNDAFGVLGRHPRMIDPIEQLFGEKLYMHQFKINAKAAFTGDVWLRHLEARRRHAAAARDEHRDLPRRGDADQWAPDAGAAQPECRGSQGFSRPGNDVLPAVDAGRGDGDAAGERRRHRRAHRQGRRHADVPW